MFQLITQPMQKESVDGRSGAMCDSDVFKA